MLKKSSPKNNYYNQGYADAWMVIESQLDKLSNI